MSDDTTPTVEMLRSNSLTKVVQHEIERMILSGELPAGSRLNENAVAAKLSVSRGPVREACRALAELGFVYQIPNRGVFVKRLDKAEAMEVYDMRAGLTAFAGSLLAPVITDEQLLELDCLLDDMEQAAQCDDFASFYDFNIEFHDRIVRFTGNGRLLKSHRGLVKEYHLFRKHGLVQGASLLISNGEHRAIVGALRQRDARACYDASFAHIAKGKDRMLGALDGTALDSPPPAGAPLATVE